MAKVAEFIHIMSTNAAFKAWCHVLSSHSVDASSILDSQLLATVVRAKRTIAPTRPFPDAFRNITADQTALELFTVVTDLQPHARPFLISVFFV